MDGSIYRRFGLEPVINAAGKMTALGGTAQSDEVAQAQAAAARAHIDIEALRKRAGELIAQHSGAQAASVTTGAAAGIAISVAACITGAVLERVVRLPDSDGWSRRVLLQAGHDVNFGAAVTQMICLGGGRAHIVESTMLDEALRANDVVALLFVQSHHSAQQNIAPLDVCIAACHRRQIPVIVDAAAEEDLQRYIAAGADLVTYSGGKAFGGPTVGFIAGRRDLIEACELQQRGIARAMKVGKEQIIGLLVALERYVERDEVAEAARRNALVGQMLSGLHGVAGLKTSRKADEAGRGIDRVALERSDGGDIRELARYLAAGTPSIRLRNHHLAGMALIDPREIDSHQAQHIVERVRAFFKAAFSGKE
jgi:L-seryl-tRNA(Ser) seleniumtransferase/D-glucosaminate-6-phosphate ammonia-lyase